MDEFIHSKEKRRVVVISMIHISLVFHRLLYLCLHALFTRVLHGGRRGGWEVCIDVFTVQKSLVCI